MNETDVDIIVVAYPDSPEIGFLEPVVAGIGFKGPAFLSRTSTVDGVARAAQIAIDNFSYSKGIPREHVTIRKLELVGHGAPGFLSLAQTERGDGLRAGTFIDESQASYAQLGKLKPHFSERTVIRLLGCNTGTGAVKLAAGSVIKDGPLTIASMRRSLDVKVEGTTGLIRPVHFSAEGFDARAGLLTTDEAVNKALTVKPVRRRQIPRSEAHGVLARLSPLYEVVSDPIVPSFKDEIEFEDGDAKLIFYSGYHLMAVRTGESGAWEYRAMKKDEEDDAARLISHFAKGRG